MNYNDLAAKHERVNRLLTLGFFSLFDDMSITSMQAMTLSFIMSQTEQGLDVFQKDLESFLFIRGSSVTSIVNNLEEKKLVRRVQSAFDARCKCLVPTNDALKLRNEIERRFDDYNKKTYRDIDEQDLLVYEKVLEKMIENRKSI